MDGDVMEPIPDEAIERGWAVYVLHLPVEGSLPDLPKGWKHGMNQVFAKRQVMAAWDPKRWEHPQKSDYADPELVTIFHNATYRIRLRAK